MDNPLSVNGLKSIAWDVLKTTASVVAVNALGIPNMVREVVPVGGLGKVGGYATDGVIYGLANEVVDYATMGSSTLSRMEYANYLDNVIFFGAVSGVSVESGLVNFAYDQMSGLLPLSSEMNLNLTEGLVISSGRVAADLIDANPNVPNFIKYVRHPSHLWM